MMKLVLLLSLTFCNGIYILCGQEKPNLPPSGLELLHVDSIPEALESKVINNQTTYFSDGRVKSWTNFHEKKSMTGVSFYENGRVKLIQLRNISGEGKYSYVMTEYYESGRIKQTDSTYASDSAQRSMRYYENGQLLQDVNIGKGKQHLILYHENGQIALDCFFVDMPGIFLVGQYMSYYKDGSLKEEKHYKEGIARDQANIPIGSWKYWDENGNLVRVEKYQSGELVESIEPRFPKTEEGTER